jgi:hypothetical protein
MSPLASGGLIGFVSGGGGALSFGATGLCFLGSPFWRRERRTRWQVGFREIARRHCGTKCCLTPRHSNWPSRS